MKTFITEIAFFRLTSFIKNYATSIYSSDTFRTFLGQDPEPVLRQSLMAREITITSNTNSRVTIIDDELKGALSELVSKSFFYIDQPDSMRGLIGLLEKDLGIISEHPAYPNTYLLNKKNTLVAKPQAKPVITVSTKIKEPAKEVEKKEIAQKKSQPPAQAPTMKMSITEETFKNLFKFIQRKLANTFTESLKTHDLRDIEKLFTKRLARRGITIIKSGTTKNLTSLDQEVALIIADLTQNQIFYATKPKLVEGLIEFLLDDLNLIKRYSSNIYKLNSQNKTPPTKSGSSTLYVSHEKNKSGPAHTSQGQATTEKRAAESAVKRRG